MERNFSQRNQRGEGGEVQVHVEIVSVDKMTLR
jgi:hypothetical protein